MRYNEISGQIKNYIHAGRLTHLTGHWASLQTHRSFAVWCDVRATLWFQTATGISEFFIPIDYRKTPFTAFSSTLYGDLPRPLQLSLCEREFYDTSIFSAHRYHPSRTFYRLLLDSDLNDKATHNTHKPHLNHGLDVVDTFEIPYSCKHLYVKARLSSVH